MEGKGQSTLVSSSYQQLAQLKCKMYSTVLAVLTLQVWWYSGSICVIVDVFMYVYNLSMIFLCTIFFPTQNLSANELKYFLDNLYYLNMHTEQNPNGELRGQVSAVGDWLCPSTDQLINQCTYKVYLKLCMSVHVVGGVLVHVVGGVLVGVLVGVMGISSQALPLILISLVKPHTSCKRMYVSMNLSIYHSMGQHSVYGN